VGLPFQDHYNIKRLKRFRDRSLCNPNWVRNTDQVLSHLTRGVIPTADEHWPDQSPLSDLINEAVIKTKDFANYARGRSGVLRSGNDESADRKWTAVKESIDALIGEAEKRRGKPV
jgi:hypothetical protein